MRGLHGGGPLLTRGPPQPPSPAVRLPRPGPAREEQDPHRWHLDGRLQEDLLQERHACSFHQAGVWELTRPAKRPAGHWAASRTENLKPALSVQSESPNITERLRLKKSLGCRNFHWFLSAVYPELYIPQDRPALSGEVGRAHVHARIHTNTHCKPG